ncbi:hypothetical protein KCTCHS21_01580 [Cohnella abietis]|uniref:Uncharacterized protein n=1 Tax=Cohnella abietis TaxID=2507935 RepID=A0A3T1CYA7_9BACL|nr:hypothetical protein KCTCHS21_01580 [Cohnella abietis]
MIDGNIRPHVLIGRATAEGGHLIGKYFELGRIVVTPSIIENVTETEQMVLLNQHANCNWGEISEHDSLENENGLKHGSRLMSVYTTENGVKLYVITEADRSYTTMLLPEDY